MNKIRGHWVVPLAQSYPVETPCPNDLGITQSQHEDSQQLTSTEVESISMKREKRGSTEWGGEES